MTALSKIKSAGFSVTLVDGFIEISPGNKLTDTQRVYLKTNKAEIILELQAEATNVVELQTSTVAANDSSPNAKQPYGDWRRFCRQCKNFTRDHYCTVKNARQIDEIPRHCDDWLDNGKPVPNQR